MKLLRIDLGTGDPKDGEHSPEGYLKQDVDPTIPGLDIVCDIPDLHQHVTPASCEKIRASHVFEHFPTKQIPELFKMVYGLLAPGGEFEVIVPNFEWHARLVLQGDSERAVYYAFGGQLDEWDFHKTGFTPYILEKRLTESGFTVESLDNSSSITAICRKSP
jgi:predicted SAM-dependent methyltransferase